jgi:hypothetical protein
MRHSHLLHTGIRHAPMRLGSAPAMLHRHTDAGWPVIDLLAYGIMLDRDSTWIVART